MFHPVLNPRSAVYKTFRQSFAFRDKVTVIVQELLPRHDFFDDEFSNLGHG
jgi:hypothetical protein